MILDVGCGDTPRTLRGPSVVHVDLDRSAFDLEALADVNHLPFPDGCFKVVHASHVIEHLENPMRAIEEIRRVCSGVCVVRVPDARMFKVEEYRGCAREHLYSWNSATLRNLLSRVFCSVVVHKWRSGHPSKLQTLKLMVLQALSSPYELVAVCRGGR